MALITLTTSRSRLERAAPRIAHLAHLAHLEQPLERGGAREMMMMMMAHFFTGCCGPLSTGRHPRDRPEKTARVTLTE